LDYESFTHRKYLVELHYEEPVEPPIFPVNQIVNLGYIKWIAVVSILVSLLFLYLHFPLLLLVPIVTFIICRDIYHRNRVFRKIRDDFQHEYDYWKSNHESYYNQHPKLIEEQNRLQVKMLEEEKIRKECYDYWPGYPPDWEERKKEIHERDNNMCQKCGAIYDGIGISELNLHAHHKKKWTEGGSHKAENLTTLCRSCHEKEPGHEHMVNAQIGK
jgi:5-methylcytosine-specific restriction endonuclease McrA